MAQYKTGDPNVPQFIVENGSQTVIIPGVDARTDIPFSADRPPYFREQETGPTYEVADEPQYVDGDTIVTLTGAWQGDSGEIDGLFHVDFSANMGYPLFYSGDIDIPDILRRWVVDLDGDMAGALGGLDGLGTAAKADVGTGASQIRTNSENESHFVERAGTPLTSADDLNDIVEPGWYSHSQASAPSNAPTHRAGYVFVYAHVAPGFIYQIWAERAPSSFVTGDVYKRFLSGSSEEWTPWVRILDETDLASEGGTIPETNRENEFSYTQTFKPANSNVVFRIQSDGVDNEWVIIHNSNTGQLSIHNPENLQNSRLSFSPDNGLAVGGNASTHGMGPRTLNAVGGLYDNGNRVVTDYVFDAALDQSIDIARYDAAIGDREVEVPDGDEEVEEEVEVTETVEVERDEWCDETRCYVRRTLTQERPVYTAVDVRDESGAKVGEKREPKTERRKVTRPKFRTEIEPGRHEPARRFVDNFDDLDPREFAKKWRASRKLPAFERLEQTLDEGKRPSLGNMLQAVLETVEVQAVHIAKLEERISDLETPAD